MQDFILLLATAAMFAFGFWIMKKADEFFSDSESIQEDDSADGKKE